MSTFTQTAFGSRRIRVERRIPVFRGKLKRSPYDKPIWAAPRFGDAVLLEFVDDPRFIIRRPDGTFSGNKAKVIRTARIAQKLFKELEVVYNIPVPVQFVVGRNVDGNVSFYAITKKVRAVNLDDLVTTEKAEVFGRLKKIFETLLTYYENKARTREHFLIEVLDDQFVYGTIEGCPEPQWYMVDTDPVFSKSLRYMRYMFQSPLDTLDGLEATCRMELPDLYERIVALYDSLSPRRKNL